MSSVVGSIGLPRIEGTFDLSPTYYFDGPSGNSLFSQISPHALIVLKSVEHIIHLNREFGFVAQNDLAVCPISEIDRKLLLQYTFIFRFFLREKTYIYSQKLEEGILRNFVFSLQNLDYKKKLFGPPIVFAAPTLPFKLGNV